MNQEKTSFKHESLQDKDSVQDLLKAITKGIAKGELTFSDEEGEIQLKPKGVLTLKVSAKQDDSQNRVDIRIAWQSQDRQLKNKPLMVNSPKTKVE